MTGGVLTSRDRRTLFVGMVAVFGLVLAFRGLPAWRAWQVALEARTAADISAIDGDAMLLEAFPTMLDTLELRLAQLREDAPGLLGGDDADEAASNLAALVADIARRSPARLEAVNVRIDSSGPRLLPRVQASVHTTTDIAGLAALLQLVESAPTLLRVMRLSVTPQNVALPPDQVEQLSVRIEIEGLVLLRQAGTALASH